MPRADRMRLLKGPPTQRRCAAAGRAGRDTFFRSHLVVPIPLLYALLYGRGMSKSVTIRVPEELHTQLQELAEAEGTSVTALITEAARNAVRDPRLEGAAEVFRSYIAENADAFDAAFPDDAPARQDASRAA